MFCFSPYLLTTAWKFNRRFQKNNLENYRQDIVTQQNVWLTDELTAKTNELGKLRQSSTEITCKLKSELAQKSEETAFLNVGMFRIHIRTRNSLFESTNETFKSCHQLTIQNTMWKYYMSKTTSLCTWTHVNWRMCSDQESQKTLKAHTGKLEKKVSELTTKLQDKDAAHLTDIENIRLQLNKQERLTELYNSNCEEYQVDHHRFTLAFKPLKHFVSSSSVS